MNLHHSSDRCQGCEDAREGLREYEEGKSEDISWVFDDDSAGE